MAVVIFIYKLYVGKSNEYSLVESRCHICGYVGSVEVKDNNKYTISIVRPKVYYGTAVLQYEKLLLYLKSEKSIKVGNILEIKGRAEPFPVSTNKGQFNAYRYYREQDYAYKVLADTYTVINDKISFREYLRQISDYIINVFKTYLPENDAAIVSAMLFGRKSLLNDDDKEMYRINGLMHLLAVSGTHIGTISMLLIWLISKMPVGFKTGRVIIYVIMLLYGILTGFSVSCIRAVVMFGLKLLAQIIGREYDNISALSFAAIITLAINPRSLFHCDFILSYLAVIAITVVYPYIEKVMLSDAMREIKNNQNGIHGRMCFIKLILCDIVIKPLLVSVCITIITTPAIMYFYYEAPMYSMIVNLIVLPCVSIIFIMACLCAVTGFVFPVITMFFAGSIHYIFVMYRVICGWCIDNVYYVRLCGFPGFLRVMLCYVVIGILILILFITKRAEAGKLCDKIGGIIQRSRWMTGKDIIKFVCKFIWMASFILTPLCLNQNNSGNLEISFLDVGQGDGIIIKMPDGKVLCIDGGSSDVADVGRYRIEPYLSYKGIKHVDYWIITHPDGDHCSGIWEILSRRRYNGISIDYIVLPDTEMCRDEVSVQAAGYSGYTDFIYINSGMKFSFDEVTIQCLNPTEAFEYKNQNEGSIVLDLKYGKFDALFTGDVEGEAENELIKSVRQDYELLKVAHHGSKNSSPEELINRVSPKYSVISCGRNNSYGHPHKETLLKLAEVGSRIIRTDESGEIVVQVGKKGYTYFLPLTK